MGKFKCNDCGWCGDESKVLTAQNPFSDETDTLMGCPECREVNRLSRACDEPGCQEDASSGAPIPGGYKWSCFDHRPEPR